MYAVYLWQESCTVAEVFWTRIYRSANPLVVLFYLPSLIICEIRKIRGIPHICGIFLTSPQTASIPTDIFHARAAPAIPTTQVVICSTAELNALVIPIMVEAGLFAAMMVLLPPMVPIHAFRCLVDMGPHACPIRTKLWVLLWVHQTALGWHGLSLSSILIVGCLE